MADERILVIDDEPGVRTALEGILEDEGFQVESAGSGEEGLERAARGRFDAILLDVWLPGIDGLETLEKLQDSRVDTQVIMISGLSGWLVLISALMFWQGISRGRDNQNDK